MASATLCRLARVMLQSNNYAYTVARCIQMMMRDKAYQNTFFDLGGMTSYAHLYYDIIVL